MSEDKAVWDVTAAQVSLHKESGHGVEIEINGNTKHCMSYVQVSSMSLDIVGNIWSVLPPGMETLAKFTYLPLDLKAYMPDHANTNENHFEATVHLGTKERGTFGIKSGDPAFALDFCYEDKLMFSLPTKPSLILSSINKKTNALITTDVPNFRRNSLSLKILRTSRWLFFPALFAVLQWLLLLSPFVAQAVVPVVPFFSSSSTTSFSDLLPLMPNSQSQAWMLGKLEFALSSAENSSTPNAEINEILASAAKIVNRRNVTVEELHSVLSRILESESHKGIYEHVVGFFSFVNIVWLVDLFCYLFFTSLQVAILGICISIIPALHAIWPFQRKLLWFLWNTFIKPVALFLHRVGVFEALVYFVSAIFAVDGTRRPAEWGFFISVTGLGLALPCFLYSTLLHSAKLPFVRKDSILVQIVCIWITLCWMPMSALFNSTLIAFGALFALYSALGFSVVCSGLCYFIGFEGDSEIKRVSTASALLLIIFTSLRITHVQETYVELFSCPVQVIGTLTLLLALLILSSYWYGRNDSIWLQWGVRQLEIISVLLVITFVGNIWNLTSMTNTAYVFWALYITEKYVELHLEKRWNIWILIFLASITLWRIALFIHSRPGFIVSMFYGF